MDPMDNPYFPTEFLLGVTSSLCSTEKRKTHNPQSPNTNQIQRVFWRPSGVVDFGPESKPNPGFTNIYIQLGTICLSTDSSSTIPGEYYF